ncbi:MAG: cell division protein ZipA [Pseudomonadota bacterium]|nr:cell division protein ZipA [Pseudomonadota bacterium]
MDTKDLIIIAGSIFFVLIVVHGLWVARRQRLNEIRMDIEATDNLGEASSANFNSELPNGGARVISEALKPEADESYEREESGDGDAGTTSGDPARKATDRLSSTAEYRSKEPSIGQPSDQKSSSLQADATPPIDDLFGNTLVTPARRKSDGTAPNERKARDNSRDKSKGNTLDDSRPTKAADDSRRSNPQIEELLILGVMARPETPFGGEALVAALRGQGLKYGDMGIFHRVDDSADRNEVRLFSVANAVEPGTFDLSDLAGLQTPGLTFFMQLPVPGDALETLDDMVLSARTVAAALGGDVKDDKMSALTGQTIEHMRQRISDYALKQLTANSDG